MQAHWGLDVRVQALGDIIEQVVPAPWSIPWDLGECSGEGGQREVAYGGS